MDVPLRIIDCAGSPRARGRAHGEELRDQIDRALHRWQGSLERAYERADDDVLIEWLAQTSFVPAIRRFAPELLEEVRGIAEGAGAPFGRVLAFNLMDEEWWWWRGRQWQGAEEVDPSEAQHTAGGCTTVAVRYGADGAPLLGQTMDLDESMDGEQAVLRIADPRVGEQLVLTRAGMIGLCGMNTAGVGLCVNALLGLRPSTEGLPVAFITRSILARPTLASAAAFVARVPHASGQSYTIASRHGLVSFEGSAAGVVEVPAADGPSYGHANHPLASSDRSELDMEPHEQRNLTRLRQRFADEQAGLIGDLAGLEAFLADTTAPICWGGGRVMFTFGSIAMSLGAQPRFRAAPGPAAERPFADVPAAAL